MNEISTLQLWPNCHKRLRISELGFKLSDEPRVVCAFTLKDAKLGTELNILLKLPSFRQCVRWEQNDGNTNAYLLWTGRSRTRLTLSRLFIPRRVSGNAGRI